MNQSDHLIDDKIAWHSTKIKECLIQLDYHKRKRKELRTILITIGNTSYTRPVNSIDNKNVTETLISP